MTKGKGKVAESSFQVARSKRCLVSGWKERVFSVLRLPFLSVKPAALATIELITNNVMGATNFK